MGSLLGPEISINTSTVQQAGNDIISNATKDENPSGTLYNLDNQLRKLQPGLPMVAQQALEGFRQAYIPAYQKVLANRIQIGKLLAETASQTEIQEFKHSASFDPKPYQQNRGVF